MTTQLLVSVRSADEAATALQSAVDVIDIKEPARGPLGAADPGVIGQIVECVGGERPVSVALGELLEFDLRGGADLPHVDYLKLGLAGCAKLAEWPRLWQRAWQPLPASARRVAVAYADAPVARAPGWTDILQPARDCGCSVLLLDTFDKCGGGLLDWLDHAALCRVRRATQGVGLQLALAGSLTRSQIVQLLDVQADFIAVRAAACRGQRQGELSAECIEEILAALNPSGSVKT
jgi:(5-formylfuran-3-yl)methyl phosphate synthase